jgi:hypothetical protein
MQWRCGSFATWQRLGITINDLNEPVRCEFADRST